MSLGYAEKLSYIEDVGEVGMSEFIDPSPILLEKIEQLSMLIKKSKHLVVFTGAGISTACGIPDFRGPKGIWTLQRDGKALPKASLPFHRAMPSMTHMALVELEKAGILKFVISQNIDGLHLRSGIPREKLAELHGNTFMETCPSCGAEYLRDFEVETIGLKETSRSCSNEKCGAKLKDTVLDWEDALPPKEMNAAEKHCKKADLVLCLGTSLQIRPACNLPLKCLRGDGKIVIVNLQKTPKDEKASLLIHGRVDKVIAGVMESLTHPIPSFVRIDFLLIRLTQGSSSDERFVNWVLQIASVHGKKAPLPFVKSVEVSFVNCENYKNAILQNQSLKLKRRTLMTNAFELLLKFKFSDGCGCKSTEMKIPVDFKAPADCFNHDKDAVIQKLKDTALKDSCSGQNAAVEKMTILSPKTNVTVFAIVTNIVSYEKTSKTSETAYVSNGYPVKKRKEGMNGCEAPKKILKGCKSIEGRLVNDRKA